MNHSRAVQIFRHAVYDTIKKSAISRNYADSATFKLESAKLYKLEKGPATETTCTRDDALKFIKYMITIREIEKSCGKLYREKLVKGFLHLYTGQEAVCTGFSAAMRPGDVAALGYRSHGWVYVLGSTSKEILCEITGRETGMAQGRGGSMHLYSSRVYGGQGIIGAQSPIATGLAFAKKYLGTKDVGIGIYGDGAAHQGQNFEVFNMAKLWNIPCIYIIENNIYGMGTSVERQTANTLLYTKSDMIPGMRIDGMDVLTTREAGRYAVEYCSSGKGPIIIEVMCYRYHGHSMSDPAVTYRTREEVQKVREQLDCIETFKKKCIDAGLITEDDYKKVDKAAKDEVKDAEAHSRKDPFPKLEEVAMNTYVVNIEQAVRGVDPIKKYKAGLTRKR